MIVKSYLVEDNLATLKNNIALFYGENLGLVNEFKEKIILSSKKSLLLRYTQEEILKNEDSLFREIKNFSLFEEGKVFFVQDVGDKFLKILEEVIPIIGENKLFLFTGNLEKKSKLRIFFEKKKEVDLIACYQDNELTIKKVIIRNLKGYTGVTTQVVDSIKEACSSDRLKLNNEINKIKAYFIEKKINLAELHTLLNNREDDDFNLIKDNALNGKKIETNILLNSTVIEPEKFIYYIAAINQRLSKLKQVMNKKNINLETVIGSLKPPIFWKDKPNFIYQAKIWDINKLNKALDNTYNVELKIKTNSNINKEVILKKLLVDICNIANPS